MLSIAVPSACAAETPPMMAAKALLATAPLALRSPVPLNAFKSPWLLLCIGSWALACCTRAADDSLYRHKETSN